MHDGKVLVSVSPKLFRPTEVDTLQGDMTKLYNATGWTPSISFYDLVCEMLKDDLHRYGLILHPPPEESMLDSYIC